jgi:small subunit ribosomal protein S1
MNLHRTEKRKYLNDMPQIENGWWDAILAEEERSATPRAPQTGGVKPKPEAQRQAEMPVEKPADAINWDAARKLFADDSILEIHVTGHNHGGLLVENETFSGFIPFSHLVNLAGRESDTNRDECLNAYAGKTLKVKMIECVPEDGRIIFSERAALTPPGKRVELFHSLQVGDRVTGTVTNVTEFGVFVDLGGVEGLIHLSELSWGRVSHPNQVVRVDEAIQVQVLEISIERNRVALSLKRLIPNPWARAESDFPVGRVLPAIITSVLSYGAFARLAAGVEGLIHVTEMSLDENQTPRDVFAVGQPVEVRVLHVEPRQQRLGLSLKLNRE